MDVSRAASAPIRRPGRLTDALRTASAVTSLELQLGRAEDLAPFVVTNREEQETRIRWFVCDKDAPKLELLMHCRLPQALVAHQAQAAVFAVVVFGDEDFGLRWSRGVALGRSRSEPCKSVRFVVSCWDGRERDARLCARPNWGYGCRAVLRSGRQVGGKVRTGGHRPGVGVRQRKLCVKLDT